MSSIEHIEFDGMWLLARDSEGRSLNLLVDWLDKEEVAVVETLVRQFKAMILKDRIGLSPRDSHP